MTDAIKTIYLLSNQSEDKEFTKLVASEAGLSFKLVSSHSEVGAIFNSDASPLFFIDATSEEGYFAFERSVHEFVGLFSDKINPNRIHFICSNDFGSYQYLSQSPIFGFFIQKPFYDMNKAAKLYGRAVKVSLKDHAFGLESYLADGANIQVIKLKESLQ